MPEQAAANPNPLSLSKVLEQEYTFVCEEQLPVLNPSSDASQHSQNEETDKEREARLEAERKAEEEACKTMFKKLHKKKLVALCLSGGGIRSATFALGIIQGLARKGFLQKIDYLSTVSGGGYIGGWLSAWIHREGFDKVNSTLTENFGTLDTSKEHSPINHLRQYSNYLTPQLGLLTADTWAVVATIIRNLILNWTILVPLLMLGMVVPRLAFVLFKAEPVYFSTSWGNLYWRDLALLLSFLFGVYGLVGFSVFRPSEKANLRKQSDASNDTQARVLLHSLLPILLSGIFMALYWAWLHLGERRKEPVFNWGEPSAGKFAVFTLAMTMLASCLCFIKLKVSAFTIRKLLAAIAGGLLAGLLAYPIAINFFPTSNSDSAQPSFWTLAYVCFAFPLTMAAFFLATVFFAALQSKTEKVLDDEDREWLARLGAWVLIVALVWGFLTVMSIWGPWGIYFGKQELEKKIVALGGISGVITWLLGKSSFTSATSQKEKGSRWQNLALAVAAPIFVVFFFTVLSLWASELIELICKATKSEALQSSLPQLATIVGADAILANEKGGYQWHIYIVEHSSLPVLLILCVGLALVGLGMGFFVNVNKFSLHAMYRNRLIRAYLGASRTKRNANPFTGFDAEDNFPMHELRENHQKPFHVINMALNLVKGENLAWQERKAESFTVSPLHSGCLNDKVGYRSSTEYGNLYGRKGISLGTAMAISGAAVSSNMGYHSSSVITFLLTLFNARLGWWLGNPNDKGKEPTYQRGYPRFAVRPILAEMFGFTNDKNPYIYLSDGGHFENLGLYEMVVRRCRFIIVSDAGCDEDYSFDDFGNAIRKIRIDLGIPIEIEKGLSVFACSDDDAKNKTGKYCAIATIKYSAIDKTPAEEDGTLIYFKPAYYRQDEPADVFNYAKENPHFPHETTADQFFSESQFESYRMLGLHAVETVCKNRDNVPQSFSDFGSLAQHLRNVYLKES